MPDQLSRQDFDRLAVLIHSHSGIRMPDTKRVMVEGRLRRRVRALALPNLGTYCRMLFDEDWLDGELPHLIDAVTTNKTEFFREPDHFRYLIEGAVPRLLDLRRRTPNGVPHPGEPLKLWSAASSCGAEPYTLAMVLADLELTGRAFPFGVLATDICTTVLQQAVTAVYPEEMIAPVPLEMRKRHILRSRDPSARQVRVAPEIRRLVRFGRLNLMDASYPVDADMDVIFCRNILIYFDKPTQQAVLERLCSHLRPGGYLFLGHSESMAGVSRRMEQVVPTVFRML